MNFCSGLIDLLRRFSNLNEKKFNKKSRKIEFDEF